MIVDKLWWALEGKVVDGTGLLMSLLTASTNLSMDSPIFWNRSSN